MVYSAEIGHVKSEPEFFVVATAALTNAGDEHAIVFVDDTPVHVEVARLSGWNAVQYEAGTWPGHMEAALDAAAAHH